MRSIRPSLSTLDLHLPRFGGAVTPAQPTTTAESDEQTDLDEPWSVILYNDEIHTFEEVISQIMKATGCGKTRAEGLTWEVHHDGKANVFSGAFEECLGVEGVLAEIGLVTEIRG